MINGFTSAENQDIAPSRPSPPLKSSKMPRNLAIAAVLLVYLTDFTAAGNTTCSGNMTQWYTDAVGETACETLPLFHHFLTSPVQ
jgi:hypothetical protein